MGKSNSSPKVSRTCGARESSLGTVCVLEVDEQGVHLEKEHYHYGDNLQLNGVHYWPLEDIDPKVV